MRNLLLLAAALLCACAARQAHWSPVSGSKADAMVRLGYAKHGARRVKLSDDEAQNMALAKCRAWGFEGAEAFGGLSTCTAGGPLGCTDWLITREYQCTGDPH